MSYSVEWIEPITDRSNFDVINAENHRQLINPIGAYNFIDLNRIENNTIYVKEYMLDKNIIDTLPTMTHKTDWAIGDVVNNTEITRIIENVRLLMNLSNPEITDVLKPLSVSNALSFQVANTIEHNLEIMAMQPEIPVVLYTVRLDNGIIEETGTNIGQFKADTVIHVSGLNENTGIDEYCIEFSYWSGDKNDLQYLGDVNAQSTTFICQHHDIDLVANFKFTKLIKVIVEDGYIYGDNECESVEYTTATINGLEIIHGSQYIAHVGDLLDITYAPTRPNTSLHKHINTTTFGSVDAEYDSLQHYPNEKFVGWEFYVDEPFFETFQKLDKNDILLSGCDTPSTTISVPNVSTLIIRPKFIRIPSTVKFQRRRPTGNMGTVLYYRLNLNGSSTGQFNADDNGIYASLGYTFEGWMVCYGTQDYLIQSETLVNFINEINTPDTEGNVSQVLEINFTEDMFVDYDGPDTINVYAVWLPRNTTSTGMCEITRYSAPLVTTRSASGSAYDQVAIAITYNNSTLKTINHTDVCYRYRSYDYYTPSYSRYVLRSQLSKFGVTYSDAVRFNYTLSLQYSNESSVYREYVMYLPVNSSVTCIGFPQAILQNRWNDDVDSHSIYDNSSYIQDENFLGDICCARSIYSPGYKLQYDIADNDTSETVCTDLNKLLMFVKPGASATTSLETCRIGFVYDMTSTLDYNVHINYGVHSRNFEKTQLNWYKPLYIVADNQADVGFVSWDKYSTDDLNHPSDNYIGLNTQYDIIESHGHIQLTFNYRRNFIMSEYVVIKPMTNALCEISVTDGTIISYAELSDHPEDSNYQQCHTIINNSSAILPGDTHIKLAHVQKYGQAFTHWKVVYTLTSGSQQETTVEGDYVATSYYLYDSYQDCSAIEITAVYTENIDYAIVSLNDCYIAYCDKNYIYDNPRSARVEKGSTLVVFPDVEGFTAMYWGGSRRDTFVLTVEADISISVVTASTNRPISIATDDTTVSMSSISGDTHKIPSWYDLPSKKFLTEPPKNWNVSTSITPGFTSFPLPKYMKFISYTYFIDGISPTSTYFCDMAKLGGTSVSVADTQLTPYNPDMQFTCAVYDRDGEIRTYYRKYNEQLIVEAETAPEGYEFYKWDGDIQYISDVYSSSIDILMPADNFVIKMLYKPQDYDIISYVKLHEGKIKLEDGTLVSEGEFKEGTVLTIVGDENIPEHWMFYRWGGQPEYTELVEDIYSMETTLLVKDFDIELTRELMEHAKWSLTIINGEVSGTYYESDLVAVYFVAPEGTTSYTFTGWSGDITDLLLANGTPFDTTKPGTPDEPQIIVMPAKDISLTATFDIASEEIDLTE